MTDSILRPCPKPSRTPKRVETKPRPSKRSKKSGGRLFPGNVSLSRRRFIKAQACVATGRKTGELVTWQPWMPEGWKALTPYVCRVIPAHVSSHGHGAHDAADLLPMDNQVHIHLQHGWGWPAFEKRLHLMPRHDLAQIYEDRYQAKVRAIAKRMEEAS